MSGATLIAHDVREGIVRLPDPFGLEHGGVILRGRLAWRALGPEDAPAVLVLGGISADRRVARAPDEREAGWWEAFVGRGRPLDTRRLRVLGVDLAGGPAGRADPAAPPGAAAGAITTRDQAHAIVTLLDALGIDALHACVGASYGGMIALALAAHAPERVQRIVVIGAADAPQPMATAQRALQREIVRLAQAAGRAHAGVRVARALGVTTYRSAREFAQRFDTPPLLTPSGFRFPVEDYLTHHGTRFAARFPADAYLRLSESLDLHRVDAGAIRTPATLIAASTDTLVPPAQMRALAARLAGPHEFHEVDSIFGHDAFLKESATIGALVRRAVAP